MKTTLVTTILNEERQIVAFIESILQQTELPDEVIIVDGGSTDKTLTKIHETLKKHTVNNIFTILSKKGNRSVGRNTGIEKASHEIILLTDAGCMLDKNWVKNIKKPIAKNSIDVVAGYYDAVPQTTFQKCLIPYVLIMPDKVNPTTFLPATRSMAMRKNIWEEVGKFDETYAHNEDYEFARRLRQHKKKIEFAKDAIVYWIPRTNLTEAFTMFYRFAFGDMEAGIIRPKVVLIFIRYLFLTLFVLTFLMTSHIFLFLGLLCCAQLYCGWAILKNYNYVRKIEAFYLLPLIQVTSDLAVMKGSIQGLIKRYGI